MDEEPGATPTPAPTDAPTEPPAETASETPSGLAAVFGPTVNAVVAPARAFEALDARPMLTLWPLLWTTLGMMLLGIWNLGVTRQIMRVAMVQGMAQRSQQTDPEQMRQMLERMDRFAPAWAIGGNLLVIIGIVLIAALLWMGSSVLGGRTTFSRSVGVASVGGVVHPLLAMTFVSVMWKLDPPEIRRMQDMYESLPSLGLDLLVRGSDASPFVRTFLSRIDLFNLWWVALVAIGGQKLLGLKKGAAVGLAIGIWLLTAAVSAFWTTLGR